MISSSLETLNGESARDKAGRAAQETALPPNLGKESVYERMDVPRASLEGVVPILHPTKIEGGMV